MHDQQIKDILEEQYKLLKKNKYKQNANILYNIAKIKHQYNISDYKQSLYLDVKIFIKSYIKAADTQDYGYDEIRFEKIVELLNIVRPHEKIKLLYTLRRYYVINGYETDIINNTISKNEISIAWNNHKYLKWLHLIIGSNIWGLMGAYLAYVFITMLILLPAPCKEMCVFSVELKQYTDNTAFNYLINTLAMLTGNENIAPQLIPIGITGVIIYALGVAIFYILIVNFLFKKIEDYISVIL